MLNSVRLFLFSVHQFRIQWKKLLFCSHSPLAIELFLSIDAAPLTASSVYEREHYDRTHTAGYHGGYEHRRYWVCADKVSAHLSVTPHVSFQVSCAAMLSWPLLCASIKLLPSIF